MKIALLQCDHVVEELQPAHGDIPDLFKNLFARVAPEVFLSVFDVTQGEYPDLSAAEPYDGFISSGARYSVYDSDPWILRFKEFVRELYDHNRKFVGICFGHQMMAEALGGKCEKSDQGWGVGIKEVKIHQKRSWMQPELDSYRMIVSHADQVLEIPENGEILGGNFHCPCSIYTVGGNFLGIQAHPEFTPAFEKDIMDIRQDRIGQQAIDAAIPTLNEKTDEAVVTRWIVQFIRNNNLTP
jgi:GMP synthase-like glutamine amidotransferase